MEQTPLFFSARQVCFFLLLSRPMVEEMKEKRDEAEEGRGREKKEKREEAQSEKALLLTLVRTQKYTSRWLACLNFVALFLLQTTPSKRSHAKLHPAIFCLRSGHSSHKSGLHSITI